MNLRLTTLAVCILVAPSCTGEATTATSTQPAIPPPPTTHATSEAPQPTPAATHRTTEVALVTAELRNELVVVSVPGGRVLRRIPVAADPKTVAAAPGGPVAVVSPGSGTVTMFGRGLRRVAVFRNFRSPQLAT